jgi:hypothetical protein
MNPISPTSRYSSPPSPATSNTQRLGKFVMNCPSNHYWAFVDPLKKMASAEGKMLLDKIEDSGDYHLDFQLPKKYIKPVVHLSIGDSATSTMETIKVFATPGELIEYFEKMNHDFNAIFGIESKTTTPLVPAGAVGAVVNRVQ